MSFVLKLTQAKLNQFNLHTNVEYEWRLGQEDIYESDDDLDEKVGSLIFSLGQKRYNGTARRHSRAVG